MEVMIETGQADAVPALGKELVESGKILAKTNDNDGSMSTDFSTCLAIFPFALEDSSLSESENSRGPWISYWKTPSNFATSLSAI